MPMVQLKSLQPTVAVLDSDDEDVVIIGSSDGKAAAVSQPQPQPPTSTPAGDVDMKPVVSAVAMGAAPAATSPAIPPAPTSTAPQLLPLDGVQAAVLAYKYMLAQQQAVAMPLFDSISVAPAPSAKRASKFDFTFVPDIPEESEPDLVAECGIEHDDGKNGAAAVDGAPAQAGADAPPPAPDKTSLKVQCLQGHVMIRLEKTKPLERLFAAFRQHAQQEGWADDPDSIRFSFDGDRLQGTETVASLDLEDDDIIEAAVPASRE